MAARDAVKRVPEIARNHCPTSAKYAIVVLIKVTALKEQPPLLAAEQDRAAPPGAQQFKDRLLFSRGQVGAQQVRAVNRWMVRLLARHQQTAVLGQRACSNH